jgi:hypothetical protein
LATAALAIAGAGLLALALSGLGVYASFTSSAAATQSITTGCLRIAFTQVDGQAPPDPRAVKWEAVVRKGEVHIVHHATVTNICTLRVGGITLLVHEAMAEKSSTGDGGRFTLAVIAAGPGGDSTSRTDLLANWQAAPWAIPSKVSALDPKQSLILTLTVDGKFSGEVGDRAAKDSHGGGGDDEAPAKSETVTYTLAARE